MGFLASEDPERLRLSPEARLDRESIRVFVKHLRQSCRDTSVASLLHMLRLALGFICAEIDWSWLKTITKRINAQAKPGSDRSRGVTSAQLYAIGLGLMAKAEIAALREVATEDALTYRDGLIIALEAAVPLRRRTLTALTPATSVVCTLTMRLFRSLSVVAMARNRLDLQLRGLLAAVIGSGGSMGIR